MSSEASERVNQLAKMCARSGWQVGVAESCTGGLLSSWISAQAGVSSFFVGGVVSYARSVKSEILGVPVPLMQTVGEVSIPVALEMASFALHVVISPGNVFPSSFRISRGIAFLSSGKQTRSNTRLADR